jgi:hypothetical protein
MTAERWLYGKLSGDTGTGGVVTLVSTRIYNGVAAQGAAYPMVVYQSLSGVDVQGVGAAFIMENEIFSIKAVTQSQTYTSAETIANRINVLLHKTSGTTTGGTVIACVRMYVDKMEIIEAGVTYKTIMQRFRIYSQ